LLRASVTLLLVGAGLAFRMHAERPFEPAPVAAERFAPAE
jgi:hypothetical protein